MPGTTVVFDIDINNTQERREWSYLELVENNLLKNDNEKSISDPFCESDMLEKKQLADLAKSLEKKYGTMVTMKKSGKRKRIRIDDFLDPGEGYDTQDSFIDDSEAIDVFVAPNVSTKHGGFFVYEGALEGLEDESIEIEAPVGSKANNTGILPRPVSKKNKSKELLEKAVKRLSTPKQVPNTTRNKPSNSDAAHSTLKSSDTSESPCKPDCGKISVQHNEPSILKNGVVAMTKSPEQSKIQDQPRPNQQQQISTPPPLPTSLPQEVTNSVMNLIKIGFPTTGNQRRVMSKEFEGELLNLYTLTTTMNINPTTRSTIFAHIEGMLQLKRKSLNRRIRKLNETNEDQKMNPLLDSLGDAIAQAMPPLLESYMRDKELHAERVKAWQAENAEQIDIPSSTTDGTPPPKRIPKPGPPKKLFRWNVECRHLFESIITLRLQGYHTLNAKGPREEYLRGLFPTLIQLWPDGWITNAALWRAALPIFQKFTAARPANTPVTSVEQNTVTTSGSPNPVVTSLKNPTSTDLGGPKIPIQSAKTVSTPSMSTAVPTSPSCTPNNPMSTSVPSSMIQSTQAKQTPTVFLTTVLPSSKPSNPTQDALRTMLHSKVVHTHAESEMDIAGKQSLTPNSPPNLHSMVRCPTSTPLNNIRTSASSNVRGSPLLNNVAAIASQRSIPIPSHGTHSDNVLSATRNPGPTKTTNPNRVADGNVPTSFRLPSINTLCVNTTTHQTVSTSRVNTISASVSGSFSSPCQSQQNVRRHTEPVKSSKPLIRPDPVQSTLITTSVAPQRLAYVTSGETGKPTTLHLIQQSPIVALSNAQIDELQQRALASSARNVSQANAQSVASRGPFYAQRQPLPAHQQIAANQAFNQRLTEQLACVYAGLLAGEVQPCDAKPPPNKKA